MSSIRQLFGVFLLCSLLLLAAKVQENDFSSILASENIDDTHVQDYSHNNYEDGEFYEEYRYLNINLNQESDENELHVNEDEMLFAENEEYNNYRNEEEKNNVKKANNDELLSADMNSYALFEMDAEIVNTDVQEGFVSEFVVQQKNITFDEEYEAQTNEETMEENDEIIVEINDNQMIENDENTIVEELMEENDKNIVEINENQMIENEENTIVEDPMEDNDEIVIQRNEEFEIRIEENENTDVFNEMNIEIQLETDDEMYEINDEHPIEITIEAANIITNDEAQNTINDELQTESIDEILNESNDELSSEITEDIPLETDLENKSEVNDENSIEVNIETIDEIHIASDDDPPFELNDVAFDERNNEIVQGIPIDIYVENVGENLAEIQSEWQDAIHIETRNEISIERNDDEIQTNDETQEKGETQTNETQASDETQTNDATQKNDEIPIEITREIAIETHGENFIETEIPIERTEMENECIECLSPEKGENDEKSDSCLSQNNNNTESYSTADGQQVNILFYRLLFEFRSFVDSLQTKYTRVQIAIAFSTINVSMVAVFYPNSSLWRIFWMISLVAISIVTYIYFNKNPFSYILLFDAFVPFVVWRNRTLH